MDYVLLREEDVKGVSSAVLNFGDNAEVSAASLSLAIWLCDASLVTAYERFAAFDGVVAEANGGFGIVLLGGVARRFDVLRIEENAVKREVIRLLVEMRREQAQIKETVSVWVATLEGMQREGSSYSDILAYRSKALAACSIPNTRSFDNALTTVFPNFVAPVDDTPNAHAEAYLLCRLRATYSEEELQTRVRLSLAGAGFMRALGVPLRSAADPSCNPTPHAGFSGGSLNWGMSFHVGTAQECCDACKAHARVCGAPGAGGRVYLNRSWEGKVSAERCAKTITSNELGTHAAQACNVFVFCPTPPSAGGLCWSNDVWNHSSGECWLKSQAAPQRPHAGAFGAYPAAYRKKHRTAPEKVQWMSGALHPGPVTVDGPHWHW